jgi:hypothetical protein
MVEQFDFFAEVSGTYSDFLILWETHIRLSALLISVLFSRRSKIDLLNLTSGEV